MTNHDVAVATSFNEHDDEGRPEQTLAEQLLEQARADGVDLVGPGGMWSDLTKQVLETGLEVERDKHLGYPNTPPRDATAVAAGTGHARNR